MSGVFGDLAIHTDAYRDAYSRINGVVIVGESLADRHFRRLAALIPDDQEELQRLGAMEGQHARDFAGCGQQLGIKPDVGLARRLLAPLQEQFMEADRAGDRVDCLVIQCVTIECFAVAAYRCYLPVADAFARPITAAVLHDEAEHLDYGEQWLGAWFPEVATRVEACCAGALPVALGLLRTLAPDLEAIGIDPVDLIGEFTLSFRQSMERIGFEPRQALALLSRLVSQVPLPALLPLPGP
jgi:fatty aldehyde decarbonylase